MFDGPFQTLKEYHDQTFQETDIGDTTRLRNICFMDALDEELLLFLCQCFTDVSDISPHFIDCVEKILNYRLVSGNEKYYNIVFSNTSNDEDEAKVCGHKFKNGDPVYRCSDCQQDPTCVMCLSCYHASQHKGHDVSFYITKYF